MPASPMEKTSGEGGPISRRGFLGGAVGAALPFAAMQAGTAETNAPAAKPPARDRKIRIGLIGCGGRGRWIAQMMRDHGGFVVHSVFTEGVARNIAEFHRRICEGPYDTVSTQRAVDGTLTAILGREAAARRSRMTMDDLIRENRKIEANLKGLKE